MPHMHNGRLSSHRHWSAKLNTWRAKQKGCWVPDNSFKRIFMYQNCCILIQISQEFVLKGLINWLFFPWRSGSDSKNAIFSLVLLIRIFIFCHHIDIWFMPQDLTNDKSILVEVRDWCRQATSHYLIQCWPSSMSQYGIWHLWSHLSLYKNKISSCIANLLTTHPAKLLVDI